MSQPRQTLKKLAQKNHFKESKEENPARIQAGDDVGKGVRTNGLEISS